MHFNSRPVIDRIATKVAFTADGCLEWVAFVEHSGYARIWLNRKNVMAHRAVYEYHFGPIPAGLVIDHLCRNKRCVRPEHLEAVTNSENVLRGVGPSVVREAAAARTHCKSGHPFDDSNLYVFPDGTRTCLTCKRQRAREHYEQNRQRYIDKAAEWYAANPERARELGREAQRRQRAKKKAA
jgi:hypothetical protein